MKVEVGPKPDLRVRGKEIPAGVGPVWGLPTHLLKTPGTGLSIKTPRKSDSQRCPTEKRRIATFTIKEGSSILPIKIAKSI